MAEPDIELEDRRLSEDSLRRDIAEAIAAAQRMPTSPRSAATTIGTTKSAASLLGASYVDIDSVMSAPGAEERYAARLRTFRHALAARPARSWLRMPRLLVRGTGASFSALRRWWRRRRQLPPTEDGRKIEVDMAAPPVQVDERTSKPYCSNLVTSALYTPYDFFPRQIVVQFSKLANLYFLFVSILQMIPSWSATGNYTTIVPLMVFVLISMTREGVEDWSRSRNDKEENNREVLVAEPGGYATKKWKDLRVGDVVRVLQNEWVPADIVLLHTSGARGQCFVETLALDGETTLKTREVPTALQEHFRVENAPTARGMCTVEDPNLDLYNFEGAFALPDAHIVPLTNGNILYRGSALRNTASVQGLVVFTGKETKMQLNASKNSRTKKPKLQGKVNNTVIFLAAFVLLISGFSTLAAERIQASRGSHYWYLQGAEVTRTQNMMGYIIMFNTLIPLSLYVSMEICKLIQRFFMQNDIDMYDPINDVKCSVQTASLNEELGQVSYIFSDKTGTLTDNVMLFRKVSICGVPWIHDLDLYFDDNEEGYLFHKVRSQQVDLNAEELHILERVARLPRKSFGGRVSNAARTSTTNPILQQLRLPPPPKPGLSRAARRSLARATEDPKGWDRSRPSALSDEEEIDLNDMSPEESFDGDAIAYHPEPSPQYVPQAASPPYTPRASVDPRVAQSIAHLDAKSDIVASTTTLTSPRRRDRTPRLVMDERTSEASAHYGERARPSVQFSTAPRPSNAQSHASRTSRMSHLSVPSTQPRASTASNWHSTANPRKEQRTPSTLALLEYLQTHPTAPYAEHARFFLLVLALCHTASPDVDLNNGAMGSEIEQLDYQAASPDELALVSAARDLGFMLIDRQLDAITLRTYPDGLDAQPRDDVYRVLETIPFTSTRKRMSVVVQLPDGRIFLLTKGADNVIIERLKKSLLALAEQKQSSLYRETHMRRSAEAELALAHREVGNQRQSLESILQRTSTDLAIQESGRRSMQHGFAPRPSTATAHSGRSGRSEKADQTYEMSEAQALKRTLEQIDEFSTEGLRTLMYGHRQLTAAEYHSWKREFDAAKTSVTDRQKKVDAVGGQIECELTVTGATGIEDKLQQGVPEAIEKLRRANIHLWMLTGDKRETAVNIGFSCRLIKDYSTVISLGIDDNLEAKIIASLEEMDSNSIAHSVVVVDGQTLSKVEADAVLMSLFVDLGLRADSVILCRASPVQKANIVASVRAREPKKTMLAIGDGANDIAMIQAADVGVGIAGREGLQAARSSDFSIGQFRFLLKLLLVHGRWNYVRTCEYVLATFHKEFMFYMSQLIFQRNTLFTGTSLFESWSISMYNTLFTSLPVIALGTMTQDLGPTVLLAVPELYQLGQANKAFGLRLLIRALVLAMLQCVMCNFLAYEFYGKDYGVKDNTLYPLGVTVYASVVAVVNLKVHFVTMVHYITAISILSAVISCGGYLLWNVLIGLVYIIDPGKTYFVAREFWNLLGTELVFWATVFLCMVIGYLFELILEILANMIAPSDTFEYQELESDPYIMQRLETECELELQQGWDYQDKLDHSWLAFFRDHWPGQPRITRKNKPEEVLRRRKRDYLAEKLGLRRKPEDYDREIQEILDRRQREIEADMAARTV